MTVISFTTKFDLRLTPKQFIFEDASDYAGQGVDPTDQNGCFEIISPSGIPYYTNVDFSNSGCDIQNSVSTENKIVIALPVNGAGVVEPGTYIIKYKSYNVTTTETSEVTNTYNYSYVAPVVSISHEADCYSPLFTSRDTTNYGIAGAELTLTRNHRLTYPVGSAGTYTSSAGSIIAVSTFYNGTQTTTISSNIEYVFEDGLTVSDTIVGSREELVNCRDICSITCCITAFETRMTGFKTSNYQKYLDEYKDQWLEMMGYVGMIKNLAIPCGVNNDKISYYLEKIKAIGNCTDDCCTEADNYSQVIGLGGGTTVVVASGGEPVIVTPTVSEGIITYTITLSEAFVEKVNASYNTIVAAGDNIGVSVSVGIDGTKTYTISGKKAIITAGNGVTVTPSSEVDGVITYLVTSNVTAGDNITVTGTGTYTIDGKNAIVVAGDNITVTPSSEVDGVITYTVSAADAPAGTTEGDGASATFEPLDGGPSITLIPGASKSAGAGEGGRYLFTFTATFNTVTPFETVLAKFKFRLEAVATGQERIITGIVENEISCVTMIEAIDVADGETVDVGFESDPVSSVQVSTMGFSWIKVG